MVGKVEPVRHSTQSGHFPHRRQHRAASSAFSLFAYCWLPGGLALHYCPAWLCLCTADQDIPTLLPRFTPLGPHLSPYIRHFIPDKEYGGHTHKVNFSNKEYLKQSHPIGVHLATRYTEGNTNSYYCCYCYCCYGPVVPHGVIPYESENALTDGSTFPLY